MNGSDKDGSKHSGSMVAVVVVNWNQPQDTLECLRSLQSVDYHCFDLVVVDNGSEDNSAELISGEFPAVSLLRQRRNLGFAGGSNIGIEWGLEQGADYVLLLNNDTVVHPDFLNHLVAFVERKPSVGIVTPKIYFYDDPSTIWTMGGRINRNTSRSRHIGEGMIDERRFRDPIECDYATGCAMLIKRAVFEEVGLLDTDYFYSYEDSDFCVRARDAGFGVYCVPRAEIWHKEATSVQGLRSPAYRYYASRNRIIFVRRRGRGIRKVGGALYIAAKLSSYLLYYSLAQWDASMLKALLWGIRDGLMGRGGVSSLA